MTNLKEHGSSSSILSDGVGVNVNFYLNFDNLYRKQCHVALINNLTKQTFLSILLNLLKKCHKCKASFNLQKIDN